MTKRQKLLHPSVQNSTDTSIRVPFLPSLENGHRCTFGFVSQTVGPLNGGPNVEMFYSVVRYGPEEWGSWSL